MQQTKFLEVVKKMPFIVLGTLIVSVVFVNLYLSSGLNLAAAFALCAVLIAIDVGSAENIAIPNIK